MRALLALSLVAIAGCASVQGDGYYGCARNGHCPSSAPFCGSDGLCHATQNTIDAAMTPDAGPADSGPPFDYPSCNGDTPMCGTNTCYYDPVLGDTNDGYCTLSCTRDSDCPDYMGAHSACVGHLCARGSMGESDCPVALASTTGRWEDGAMLRLCVSLVAAEANWYEICQLDGDCERPLSCIGGYCLRSCATSADCVPNLEICISSASGPRACLYECAGAADCNVLDGQCMDGGCHPHPGW